jgi:hypothetical protein
MKEAGEKKTTEEQMPAQPMPEPKLEQGPINGSNAVVPASRPEQIHNAFIGDSSGPSKVILSGKEHAADNGTVQAVNPANAEALKGKPETFSFSTNTPSATSTYMNSTLVANNGSSAGATAPAAAQPGYSANSKEIVSMEKRAVENVKPDASTVVVASDRKAEQKNAKGADISASKRVVRRSITEREDGDKTMIITMDDAMKSFNSGDYKKSSGQFDAILSQQPSNADALYFGGISDYIIGNDKKSEKNFDKLLKEGTKFVEGSKWYKANILLLKGKREEAKKLLDELSQSSGSYKERAVKRKADAGL